MEKATFSLPCPSRNGDEYAPSFEGYYDPTQRWNGWYAPLFTREIFDKIIEYYFNEEFNTEEDIEYLEEFRDPETAKTSLNVSMHGSLYSFGSYCLCWSVDTEDDKDNMGTVYLMEKK
jgi:hypothetical protein